MFWLFDSQCRRLKVVSEHVFSLTCTKQLQVRRDATLSCESEDVAAVTYAIAHASIQCDTLAATTRCAELSDQCANISMDECTAAFSLKHMRFIPGVSAIEGDTQKASKQRTSAIGQHVATKAVHQMPWESSLGLDRRLADALVGEGTTMFKVPALLLTDDAIEVNISDHFSNPRCSCQSAHHHVDLVEYEVCLGASKRPLRAKCILDESLQRWVLHIDAEVSNTQEMVRRLQTSVRPQLQKEFDSGSLQTWVTWVVVVSSAALTEEALSTEMWKAFAATSKLYTAFQLGDEIETDFSIGDAILRHKGMFESAKKTVMLIAHVNEVQGLTGVRR